MGQEPYPLGRLAGLDVSARPSTWAGLLGIWALGTGLARRQGAALGAAVGLGAAIAGLHWASELWHQLGHAWVAHKLGRPMTGIVFWGPFSASTYPADEPELPASTHIRRALGGPAASALLTLAAGLVVRRLRRHPGRDLARWVFWENLLIFTLGSFVPLGFNDGSSLLYWWRRKQS